MFREILRSRLLILPFLFVFVWMNSLNAQSKQATAVVVFYGKIIDADSSQNITIRFYKDFLSFEEITFPTPIKNDSFYLTIPFKENTPGFIAYGAVNVPIFIEKGDSVYVESHAKSFADSLKFEGKGGLANTYLQKTFLKFDANDAYKVEEGIAKNNAASYQKLITSYKAEKLNYLDSFLIKRDTQFTDAFKEYVNADINYWWGQNLMRYRIEHPASGVLPVPLTLSDEYFQFMDTLELNKESALNNINYLFYIDRYTKWRQERIAKGKLQFKDVAETKKELIKMKMVETFGQVLIDELEVRKEAYDALSTFANLERGMEVLYLQDITTDRFAYPYKGKRYVDKFLKIELPDGQIGWVFNGGIHLKKKIVYTKKWVDVPDMRPESMRNFKYANFKGKVMHYAVAKDLYKTALQYGKDNLNLLKDYIDKAEANPYKAILTEAYETIDKDRKTNFTAIETLPIPSTNTDEFKDSTKNVAGLLQEITKTAALDLIEKKKEKLEDLAAKKDQNIAEKLYFSTPDFSKFSKLTTISGKIGRATLSMPTFTINTNSLIREETNFPFPNRTETDFQFDVLLKSSTAGTIKMGNKSVNLFLNNGDNLQIFINGNDLYNDLTFTGEGSANNNYLVAYAKSFNDTELELETKIRFSKPEAFKRYLKSLRNDKLQFLRNYLESHTLTVEDIKYLRADINYWYAFNLMNYPYEHPIYHNQPTPMPVPVDYYDFMKEISVNNTAALPNKYYLYYVQDYLSFNSSKPENKGLSKFEMADKYLKGKPLYFYKALQHSVNIKRECSAEVEQKAYEFLNNCPYELYKEFVKLAYYESKGLIKGMDAPNFELADSDGNLVSLADYKGKVVFIDFWATWCQPCTRIIPSHVKLQNQFKDDNVVFLYVSLDRNANNWRNYINKGGFPGKHLFSTQKLVDNYKVETLPYSVLIDAEGKIVWHHTGAYSVQRMAERITALSQ